MRTLPALAVLLLLLVPAYAAERSSEVLLRLGRQDNIIKIVLESDENSVRNATTAVTAAGIRVEFPSPFTLKKPQDFSYEVSRESHSMLIAVRDVSDIRTFRLASPPRIVFEMKAKAPESGLSKQQPEQQKQPRESTAPAPRQQTGGQQPPKTAEAAKPQNKLPRLSTVIIDPGHGGADYGIYFQDVREKDTNLSLARDLAAALQKKGLKVFLTRKVDQSLSLTDRISFAAGKTPELFLALHAAAADKFVITVAAPDESGTDASIRAYRLAARQNRNLDKSRAAAAALADALKAELKVDTVIQELPLPVLTSVDAAAVVVEYPLSARRTYDQKERDRLVNAIIRGLSGNEQ